MSDNPKFPDAIAFDYEVVKKIGEGANGETWLMKSRINKTLAALKCLKLNVIEDIKNVELFMREVQLLRSIHIQGVPLYYKYVVDENGNGYLLQEYINAPSIQEMLDKGYIFSESETIDIAKKMANILFQLQTNYSPPIIHRDIKPSNILYNSETRSVHLIDFGSVAHPEKRTGGSTVAGTFGYMPPEQMMGNIAIQSDYYALGATMLHMLTGAFPGTIASTVYQLDIDPIMDEKAPQTSALTREILKILLSADPDNRPASASDLIDLLNNKSPVSQKNNLSNRLILFFKRLLKLLSLNTAPRQQEAIEDSTPLNIARIDRSKARLTDYKHLLITVEDFEKYSTKQRKCTLITRNWIRCDGYIWNIRPVNQIAHSIEYTFEINGDSWCSRRIVEMDIHIVPNVKYPIKCTVLYHPLYHSMNVIESIPDCLSYIQPGRLSANELGNDDGIIHYADIEKWLKFPAKKSEIYDAMRRKS